IPTQESTLITSELSADRVELIGEFLASRRDSDFAAGLLDQTPGDILFPLEGHQCGRIVEPHERVEDPLHFLEVRGCELDIALAEVLERESPQLANHVPEAEEVGGIRHPEFLRVREAFRLQN